MKLIDILEKHLLNRNKVKEKVLYIELFKLRGSLESNDEFCKELTLKPKYNNARFDIYEEYLRFNIVFRAKENLIENKFEVTEEGWIVEFKQNDKEFYCEIFDKYCEEMKKFLTAENEIIKQKYGLSDKQLIFGIVEYDIDWV